MKSTRPRKMNELELATRDAVESGNFPLFAGNYVVNYVQEEGMETRATRCEGLWLAVKGNIETMRYAEADRLYGDRESFQRFGFEGLTSSERIAINTMPALKPYNQALSFLSKH